MRAPTWTCIECGHEFTEPVSYREFHGNPFLPPETWQCCPSCGGSFTQTHVCDLCGETITGQYIRLHTGEEICEACFVVHDLGDD